MRQPKFKIGDKLYEVWRGHGQVPGSFTVAGVADWGHSYSYASKEAPMRWVVESRLESIQDDWMELKRQIDHDLQAFEEAKADLRRTADEVAKSEFPEIDRSSFFRALGRLMEWDKETV